MAQAEREGKAGGKTGGKVVHLLGYTALVITVVLILLLVFFRHRSVEKEQRARQDALKAGTRVQVVEAAPPPSLRTLTLTGEARPYATATLYAKVSGYLKEIAVDKGDRVRAGSFIARIESPELDSQYRAALADAQNKRAFANRERALLKDGIISQQEASDAVAAASTAEANAAALRIQKEYQVIKAPFDGVVTARFVDPGALVQSAATGQTSALPVVTLSRLNRLRIYLYLDQKSAARVKVGDRAEVYDAARPERKLPATVSRISGELDPRSRTMLCELDMANPEAILLAGGYVQATLEIAAPPYPQVPASAVYTQEEKSYLAVVGADNRVHFREVTVSDSDGKQITVAEGVQVGERVALTPGTGLVEGELVQPVKAIKP